MTDVMESFLRLFRPPALEEIANRVSNGERPSVSVRTLIGWFGYQRRTAECVTRVEAGLRYNNLTTDPHFNWTYLDGEITFMPAEQASSDAVVSLSPVSATATVGEPVVEQEQTQAEDTSAEGKSDNTHPNEPIDPTYRIGRLEVANRPPVSVAPDARTQHAITIMLQQDFSQLPVMTSERDVKGLFSWKSLGSYYSQNQACALVREAMDEYCEVSADASLFAAISLIQDNDCVLVRDATRKITGIITAYDISATFGQLAEPFLVLGEIENHIRDLLRSKFTKEEFESARNPAEPSRTVDVVDDLTFGEYLRLLENPSNWQKLGLQIDRVLFIKDLDEVRRIRNDVMHFDPEGIDTADLKKLRDLVAFLRRLRKLRGNTGPNQ